MSSTKSGHADDAVDHLRNGNAERRSAATEARQKAAQVQQASIDYTDSKPVARHRGKGHAMEQQVSSAATISPVARRAPTRDFTPRRTFQLPSNICDNKENCPSTKNLPSSIKESDEKKRPAKICAVNVGMESSSERGRPKPGPIPDVPMAQVKQEQQDCPVVIEIADSDDEEMGTCKRMQRNVSSIAVTMSSAPTKLPSVSTVVNKIPHEMLLKPIVDFFDDLNIFTATKQTYWATKFESFYKDEKFGKKFIKPVNKNAVSRFMAWVVDLFQAIHERGVANWTSLTDTEQVAYAMSANWNSLPEQDAHAMVDRLHRQIRHQE